MANKVKILATLATQSTVVGDNRVIWMKPHKTQWCIALVSRLNHWEILTVLAKKHELILATVVCQLSVASNFRAPLHDTGTHFFAPHCMETAYSPHPSAHTQEKAFTHTLLSLSRRHAHTPKVSLTKKTEHSLRNNQHSITLLSGTRALIRPHGDPCSSEL